MENIHLEVKMLNDGFLKSVWVSSGENIDFLALLNENECRHAGDFISHGQFLTLININL